MGICEKCSAIDLKPCPFCSGNPHLYETSCRGIPRAYIACEVCNSETILLDKDEAIQLWNSRYECP